MTNSDRKNSTPWVHVRSATVGEWTEEFDLSSEFTGENQRNYLKVRTYRTSEGPKGAPEFWMVETANKDGYGVVAAGDALYGQGLYDDKDFLFYAEVGPDEDEDSVYAAAFRLIRKIVSEKK